MTHKVTWGPGIRFFKCDDCQTEWQEISRDCTSPSISTCPNGDCEFGILGVTPYGYEKRYEWPTDSSGNLLRDFKYE